MDDQSGESDISDILKAHLPTVTPSGIRTPPAGHLGGDTLDVALASI